MNWCRLATALLVLVAVIAAANGDRCPQSSCDRDDPRLVTLWLNSSVSASSIRGLELTSYPRLSNGETYEKIYSTLFLTSIQELRSTVEAKKCAKENKDPGVILPTEELLYSFDFARMCCEARESWDLLTPTINRTTRSTIVTDPDNPAFEARFIVQTTSEPVTWHYEGGPGTYNTSYDVKFSPLFQKLSFEMVNYNWTAKDPNNPDAWPSYLKWFATAFTQLDEPGNVSLNDGIGNTAYTIETSRAKISWDFLKYITLDGVDYRMTEDGVWGDSSYNQTNVESFGIPTVISVCWGGGLIAQPFWQNLSYDPTLSVLMADLPDPKAEGKGNRTPAKRLHPAAYAVPIALVLAFLIAAAMIVFVPSVNEKIFKKEKKQREVLRSANDASKSTTTRATPAAAPAATPDPAEANADSRPQTSSWVRSSKSPA